MTWKLILLSLMYSPSGFCSPKSSRTTVSPMRATRIRRLSSACVKKRPSCGRAARMCSYSGPVPSTCVFQLRLPKVARARPRTEGEACLTPAIRCPIAATSSMVSRVVTPTSCATPPTRAAPWRSTSRFDPSEANCVSMAFWAPRPSASIVTTAATPMRMPSIESAVRTLLFASARRPWRRCSPISRGCQRSGGRMFGPGDEGRGFESVRSSDWMTPSRMRMRRCASRAISSSCVTMTMVMPWRLSCLSTSMISCWLAVSRLPVGSSARMMRGSLTRARAMATRCCCPPESSFDLWCTRSASPTCASNFPARAMSRLWREYSSGIATFSPALTRGNRLNCWNTKPMASRRSTASSSSGRCAVSRPRRR